MKKAVLNYWVDLVTGAALLVCAATGIVRLYPEAVSLSGGTATILGASSALWATVHDWSGVVMAAGVGLHTVLHLRWLVHMTRRMVRGETAGSPAGRDPRRTGATRAKRDPDAPLMTRKAFLLGAAAVGGAAALAGAGLLRSDASETLVASADTGGDTLTSSTVSSDSAAGASTSSSSGSSGSSSDSTTAATSESSPVTVDSGSCVGCGHCLEACPNGVFTLSGSKAVVGDAGDCTLCGRCLQVCRPQALTLNG